MQKVNPGAQPASRLPEWLGAARSRGFLSRLPESLVEELIAEAHRVQFPIGAVGLRWDEEAVTAIVLRGTARGFLSYPDGNQVTTRVLRPGDIFGVFAARPPKIARGIAALEPCELLLFDAARMKTSAIAHPEVAWALVEELTTVLNATHRALYIRAFGTVRQRVAIALVDRAAAASGDSITPGMIVLGTQSELAQAAGTVREVVASTLQALRREGIVEVRRGRVVILDPPRLAREADGGMSLGLSA